MNGDSQTTQTELNSATDTQPLEIQPENIPASPPAPTERRQRLGCWSLTPELIEEFCRFVQSGVPETIVAGMLEIHRSTLQLWRRRGDRYLLDEAAPEEDWICGLFVMSVARALGKYKAVRIRHLHSSPMWVREMTILERRDRENFGRKEPEGGDEDSFDPEDKFL
jgi:hypothetical protein